MFQAIAKLFGRQHSTAGRRIPPTPIILIMKDCFDAVQAALAPEMQRAHEGIIYLLGRTDGNVTLAVAVFRPQARTTAGSFEVSAEAMAACVAAASNLNLQVVGQIHTHPGAAYHSDGDVEGARIRYAGYASIVIPGYGRALPSLSGIAAYVWQSGAWLQLNANDVVIVPGAGPWTASNGLTSETAARFGTAAVG